MYSLSTAWFCLVMDVIPCNLSGLARDPGLSNCKDQFPRPRLLEELEHVPIFRVVRQEGTLSALCPRRVVRGKGGSPKTCIVIKKNCPTVLVLSKFKN